MGREAVSALSNAIKYGTQSQKTFLIEKGVLDCFISLLVSTDKRMLKDVLEGILDFLRARNVLTSDKYENLLEKYLKDKGAVDKIRELEHDEDEEVSRIAKEIIKIRENFSFL